MCDSDLEPQTMLNVHALCTKSLVMATYPYSNIAMLVICICDCLCKSSACSNANIGLVFEV